MLRHHTQLITHCTTCKLLVWQGNRMVCGSWTCHQVWDDTWEDGHLHDAVPPGVEYIDTKQGIMNGTTVLVTHFVPFIILRLCGYRDPGSQTHFYQETWEESHRTLGKICFLITSSSSCQDPVGKEMNYLTGIDNWSGLLKGNGVTVIPGAGKNVRACGVRGLMGHLLMFHVHFDAKGTTEQPWPEKRLIHWEWGSGSSLQAKPPEFRMCGRSEGWRVQVTTLKSMRVLGLQYVLLVLFF